MTVIRPCLMAFPYVLAALIETMESCPEILRDVCCLICVRADGIAIVNWNMEFLSWVQLLAFTHICYQGSSWGYYLIEQSVNL